MARRRSNPAFDWCRAWGHNWRPYTASSVLVNRKRMWEVTIICHGCETERRMEMTDEGVITKSRHVYMPGYQFRGSASISRKQRKIDARRRTVKSNVIRMNRGA